MRLEAARSARSRSRVVLARLRGKVAVVPGMRAFFQNPPAIRLGGRLTKSQYQLTLQSTDTKELYEFAPKLEAEMRKLAEVRDVTTDLLLKNPRVSLTIDRDKASALGSTAEQIDDALYSAYGFRQVSTIYACERVVPGHPRGGERAIRTRPRCSRSSTSAPPSGGLVPLDTLGERNDTGVGPLTVSHSGQLPSVTVSFDLSPGVSLGQAVAAVNGASRARILPRR